MPHKISLINKTFGNWIVIADGPPHYCPSGSKHDTYVCRCLCGTVKVIFRTCLLRGMSKSCGCLGKPNLGTHKMSESPEYTCWKGMRRRCQNPSSIGFEHYGGRGIKVCERWSSFENFFADMGHRPPGTSIGRINNDGDYEPGNCRWETAIQQGQNTSRAHMMTAFGVTANLCVFARQYGMIASTLYCRLKTGMSPEEALTKPVGKYTRHQSEPLV